MRWQVQFSRYVVVGAISNLGTYLLYLLLTWLGLAPKWAMTLLYVAGVLNTFVFNKRWSFEHRGAAGPTLGRYAAVYAIGYAINWLALELMVDRLGFAHQWVMAGLTVGMAVFFFLCQKYWVFRPRPSPHGMGQQQ